MAEMTPVIHSFLCGVLCLLAVGIFFCLVRAVRGPRFTDRVVALNVISTIVILMTCILAFLLDEAYLMDVAILYALLNLLAVILLSRITISRHRERKEGRK